MIERPPAEPTLLPRFAALSGLPPENRLLSVLSAIPYGGSVTIAQPSARPTILACGARYGTASKGLPDCPVCCSCEPRPHDEQATAPLPRIGCSASCPPSGDMPCFASRPRTDRSRPPRGPSILAQSPSAPMPSGSTPTSPRRAPPFAPATGRRWNTAPQSPHVSEATDSSLLAGERCCHFAGFSCG